MKELNIPILLGTKRKNNESQKVADYLQSIISNNEGISTEIIKVSDLNFEGTEGRELKKNNLEFKKKIENCDGIIIVTPEYNHGIPGSLKMALDILYDEYLHKVVGICGVSSGAFAGVRAIEHLLHTVKALGLVPIKFDLNFPKIESLFDSEGNITDDSMRKKTDKFIDEIVWMGQTLKMGRKNITK